MPRQIKCWNGRGYCCINRDCPHFQAAVDRLAENVALYEAKRRVESCIRGYVAAYSRADAERVIEEYAGHRPTRSELRDYWSPCWGNPMDGIEPERGLWLTFDHSERTPVRVY